MELQDHRKEQFVDAVAHLYLQHKRLDACIEKLTLFVEMEQWHSLTKMYDLLQDCQNTHREVGLRLGKLVRMIPVE